ncbi:MAG: alpha-glucan family phosphorylase [Thermodesulfobacteriota bacterium]
MIATTPWTTVYGVSQEISDRVWSALTGAAGNSVTYISMEIGADLDVFNPVKERLIATGVESGQDPQEDFHVRRFLHGPEKIPNYSGGLGILAGDTLKSFADLKIPVIAISLLYRKGYFSQLVDSQLGQIAWASPWQPEATPSLYLLHSPENPAEPLTIPIDFYDRRDVRTTAIARVWMKMEINTRLDWFVPEILLDFSGPETPEWIRLAADQLYNASSERAKAIQRRLLGASVTAIMDCMGITSRTIHLNEQHGVVLVLHLIAKELQSRFGDEYTILADDADIIEAAKKIGEEVVYTIHTPVKAGHDRFEKNLYAEIGHSFCQRVLKLLAQDQEFPDYYNFTTLAMEVNRATNAVSRLHKLVTRKQFPQFSDKISAITNGVHHVTWVSENRARLYDQTPLFAGWRDNPAVFTEAERLLADDGFRKGFSSAWQRDTEQLIAYVNHMLVEHRNQMQSTWIDPPNFLSQLDDAEARLSPEVYTIGFARRFSTYKRADLIFEDIEALAALLAEGDYQVNFLYAGKAHPADEPGKHLIRQILKTQEQLYRKTGGLARLVFIPGYDMQIAKMMVAGVHAWLNCPKRPLEASGTSGMKAAMNGVPNISIMDGWWVEGYHDGGTGWKFGYEDPVQDSCLSEAPDALLYAEDAASFYAVFKDVLATYYKRNDRYIDKGIMNMALNCPIFNTHRMAAEYVARYNLELAGDTDRQTQLFRKLYDSDPDWKK